MIRAVQARVKSLLPLMERTVEAERRQVSDTLEQLLQHIEQKIASQQDALRSTRRLLTEFDPNKVLARGYAIVRGKKSVGETVEIETREAIMKAKVVEYGKK